MEPIAVITTTDARKQLSKLLSIVRYSNKPIAIGRHQKAEALLIKFPDTYNPDLDDITNMNAYGGGFDFLEEEPDVYSRKDLKKSYV